MGGGLPSPPVTIHPNSSLALPSWGESGFAVLFSLVNRDSGESRHGVPVSCNCFRKSASAYIGQELARDGPTYGGPTYGGPTYGGPTYGGPTGSHLLGMGNQETGFGE